MTGAGSRNRIESVLLRAACPESYRIMPGRYLAAPLGTSPADSRFGSRSAGYGALYASPDFVTAFIESVVRDRFVRQQTRNMALREISGRVWARIVGRSDAVLTLLDLRGDGCTVAGAPTDAVHARNHAAGRALSKAIHAQHEDVDGLIHASRLTGEDVYAVFERSIGKLQSVETGSLMDHPELPDVLARHGIGLVA